MKIFFSEFIPDYSSYFFPYQVWLLKEEKEDPEKIYENGFLPIRSLPKVYYLSRSLRVQLKEFALSSENKRILKKTEFVSMKCFDLKSFPYSAEIQKFCKEYATQRLKGQLRSSSIRAIFLGEVFNYLLVFKDRRNQKNIGYAVCFNEENLLHYAHAFYDLNYFSCNLGARMMLEAVIWAQQNQKKFIYLGTCYESGAYYKTEFKGVEFFNGFTWSKNKEELKFLLNLGQKDTNYDAYLFKRKEYLEKFYGNDIYTILNNFGVRVYF